MMDPRVEKLANVLVNYSVAVQPGDKVMIDGNIVGEPLLKTLDTDEGARYVGEFAIGTNKGITRFTRNMLFDEKMEGSFHIALGASLPESGGKNESAIHWDMLCDLRDGGRIWVDDELMYEDGQFLIEI